jgi:predicted GNAT superfamily acetyltransferase
VIAPLVDDAAIGEPRLAALAGLDAAGREALRALNNSHAEATSFLDAAAFDRLAGCAFLALHVPPARALLIALDETANYASPNYLWFRARHARLVYVDRVIVDAAAQGRGLARALYGRLAEAARERGHERICCEVNLSPPNPGSDAFHARLGFVEVGRLTHPADGKTVRFLERKL